MSDRGGRIDVEVARGDLRRHRVQHGAAPLPGDGEAVLRVDECALTANNVTYGAFGEAMGYWRFFPTDDGWGRLPVWGFADVEVSTVDALRDGERVYGYFPMSTHLVVRPDRVADASFVDAAPHRAGLPPVYNQYQRVREPMDRQAERVHAVLRPLFTTSFLIDDWLAGERWFGASRVVVASASSKTALALAASLAGRDVQVVGVTSDRNADFVRSVGYYDDTVTYGDVASLDPERPTVFVDMGGDASVLAAVHTHLGGALRHSCQVGATHWEQVAPVADLPGPAPQLFFAPDHVQRRLAEWGAAGFAERVDRAWDAFTATVEPWLEVVVHRGPDAVVAALGDVVDGRVPAHQAYVVAVDPG
jgi:hypothetical protein